MPGGGQCAVQTTDEFRRTEVVDRDDRGCRDAGGHARGGRQPVEASAAGGQDTVDGGATAGSIGEVGDDVDARLAFGHVDPDHAMSALEKGGAGGSADAGS